MKGIISFILQAVLVVIAVLLFSYFDPFGMMGSKKKKLLDTPISVESIREIGKYISAEYYGEVLSTLSEVNVSQFERDSIRADADSLNKNFKKAIHEIKGKGKGLFWRQDLLDYFKENYPKIVGHRLYSTYLIYLEQLFDEDKEKRLVAMLSEEPELMKKIPDNISVYLKATMKKLTEEKKATKEQIILLGRGWVKAGINFEKFTESNCRYVKECKTIFLTGMQPEILSCTINPWFIPEQGVKGFEIIDYTKNAGPELMKKVKEDCLAKLRQGAMSQNILVKAKENARENLKTFFSLLIEGGVNDVFFLDDSLEAIKSEILKDTVITGEEISIFDSVITRSERGSYDSVSVKDFFQTLKGKTFLLNNKQTSLTCFSSLVNTIINDQLVDSTEFSLLKDLKNNISRTYPTEKFWVSEPDTPDVKRRKWFKSAVDDIDKNINQFIVSEAGQVKYVRIKTGIGAESLNHEMKKSNFMIDSIFSELKK